jgi:hypothetical protein
MGNAISVSNAITYYQREIFNSDCAAAPISVLALPAVRLMENHEFELNTIAFLFSIDHDKDGQLAWGDIELFVRKISAAGLDPNEYDFGFNCGAFLTRELCECLMSVGRDQLTMWMNRCLSTAFGTRTVGKFLCIGRDAVKVLYDVLQIDALMGRPFQWVLDVMQRHAEATLQMSLEDASLDDFVPMETVTVLMQHVAEGICGAFGCYVVQ